MYCTSRNRNNVQYMNAHSVCVRCDVCDQSCAAPAAGGDESIMD
jgi:hypothetical protein